MSKLPFNEVFPSSVNLTNFLTDATVLSEAKEISSFTRATDRSRQQIYADSINGLALEHALFAALKVAGQQVTRAPKTDMSFDFMIRLNEIDVKIDVKGQFKPDTKNFGQSYWESVNADPKTLYVCYDARQPGAPAKLMGYARHDDFIKSKFNDALYVPVSKLRQ